MTVLDAAEKVLRKAGTPLHYKTITDGIVTAGFWTPSGKTPWSTVNSRIVAEIKRKGEQSRFLRTAPGVYDINRPHVPPEVPQPKTDLPEATQEKLTYTDAAERVLRESDSQQPLHYRDITKQILALGLIATESKTPADTLRARIGDEIRRRDKSSEPQRFVRQGGGLISLAEIESDQDQTPISRKNQTSEPSNQPQASRGAKLSFTDAAEQVLRESDSQQPLHYRDITQQILALGLVATESKTPADTLRARIGDEIRRREKSNEPQRFVRRGGGMIGLADAGSDQSQDPGVVGPQPVEPSSRPQPPSEPKLSFTDAAEHILREIDDQEPLHYRELTKRILDLGLAESKSKTPAHTLQARIGDEIRRREKSNEPQRFVRRGGGMIGLADAGSDQSQDPGVVGPQPVEPSDPPQALPEPKLSYTDAAEHILRANDGKEPLHYREMARRLMDLGLVATRSVTPAHTLSAAVSSEIRRRQEANQPQRFVRLGRGLIGLADAEPEGVRKAIGDENRRVREALLDFLRSADPVEFEHLVGELFNAMGAESVAVTPQSADGGVDVRGTLLAGGAIPIQIAAQVKRWKHNVGRPVVNEIRGSLGLHDFGLVVTTGRFSSGAKQAAQIKDRKPITLIDCDHLVDLMVEHEIWVNRQQHDILTLATPGRDRTQGHE